MKLLHLTADNIFSIGKIELSLADRGLTLVTGWSYDENNGNMAGKSSVANRAIVWGLYGKTVDGIRADDVINTNTDDDHCNVAISFEGVDKHTYLIKRSRNPNVLTLLDMTDESDLSRRLEKDTQELINEALGRDHKTFIQSDFFGQGREISFLSLPGNEQRAVIEEILPVNALTQWQHTTKEQLSSLMEKIKEEERALFALSTELATTTKMLDSAKQQQTSWRTDNTIELSMLQHKLTRTRGVSDKAQQGIDSLMLSLPAGKTAEESKIELERQYNELLTSSNKLEYRSEALVKDLSQRESTPEECKECGQRLPTELLVSNQVIITKQKDALQSLMKQRGEADALRYNVKASLEICNGVLMLQSKQAAKQEETILESQLKEKQAAICPFNLLVNKYEADLLALQATKFAQVTVVNSLKSQTEHYTFWDNAFGKDLKTLLFERVCPYLEERANQYLKELNNGQIKVKFSTNKELKSGDMKDQFCVTASSTSGGSMFELFSGAEKQLTSFAVGMALSDLASLQTAGASQFMILDEPFLYQSPENCENIINFITQKLGVKKSTIILISNEDNLINLVPNRVHVVKNKGVSSLETT